MVLELVIQIIDVFLALVVQFVLVGLGLMLDVVQEAVLPTKCVKLEVVVHPVVLLLQDV